LTRSAGAVLGCMKIRLYKADGTMIGRRNEVEAVNRRQLKTFERLLEEQRAHLLAEAERTVGDMVDSKGTFADPADRAHLESDRNAELRIRDRERKLLSKIDEAMRRISDGSYGVCESCGGAIGVDRLRARPVTTLCIECKADQEAHERRPRGW
jgi:DnaK suppressor protein